jgi:Kef-type K+ transport system membrane component KefB/Trk K+ transport system NAD-binding subunit
LDAKLLITYIVGFFIIAIAANQIAKFFQKFKFPIITGLIITGIIAGDSVLGFISKESIEKLNFLNQIALAVIAFSAGSELHLSELRSRMHSIKWMTIGQLFFTFVLTTVSIYYLSGYIPFMQEMPSRHKFAVALLFGIIFVARSPSSAIAVINEMRANGPFTKTAMGVTVVKDVLVIILFAISFAIAKAFINNSPVNLSFLSILFIELLTSMGLGYLLGRILILLFDLKISRKIKGLLTILVGFGVYLLADIIKHVAMDKFHHEFIIEPLLICIIGGFVITNYSKHRIEFSEVLEDVSPVIFIIFFTLTGASLSLQTLVSVFGIAASLFFIRLLTMYIGGVFGVVAAKDNKKFTHIAWMPYLTQAGVALGLSTIIAHEFPEWGKQFETIVIAIVVINQIVGPPLFKWALNYVGETHLKAKLDLDQNHRDAVIFGLESQSIALANQLEKHNWKARIICLDSSLVESNNDNRIIFLDNKTPTLEDLKSLEMEKVEAVVLLLSDTKNYHVAEMLYENCGTKEIIVRLNRRENFDKFHELGCLIIEPATAMVSLLDHFVRSPNAATLLLGLDDEHDTIDVVLKNKDLQGIRIRELDLPTNIIILSIERDGQLLITHGYTRLRLGDILTFVGDTKTLEELRVRFED